MLIEDQMKAIHEMCDEAGLTLDDYPMPDWAESLNLDLKPVERAQLCTKDGRRVGNARITKVETIGEKIYYHVRTDIGNEMILTPSELNLMYWVGMYVLKPGE